MSLILMVILIVCMIFWFFAALPVPAVAPLAAYHPFVAWICVAILCYLVISGEGGAGLRRMGALGNWMLRSAFG